MTTDYMIPNYQEWRRKTDPRKVEFAMMVNEWRGGGGNLQGFAEAYGLPLRSLHNWLSGARTPPEYVLMMTAFAMYRDGWLPYDRVRKDT